MCCVWADLAGMADGTLWKACLDHLSPAVSPELPLISVCHWSGLWNGYSPPLPGSGAASGDGICKDEVTLDRTNFPWLAKAPSGRIHRDSNNKWHLDLSVMHQSHSAHFISYCLFLTELQGAGKIQPGRSSVHNVLIFAFSAPKHLLLGATGDRMLFYMDFWSDAGWLFSCF